MGKLEQLNLTYNDFEDIPIENFKKLKSIKMIALIANPLTKIDEDQIDEIFNQFYDNNVTIHIKKSLNLLFPSLIIDPVPPLGALYLGFLLLYYLIIYFILLFFTIYLILRNLQLKK